jgi:hypothetical protein
LDPCRDQRHARGSHRCESILYDFKGGSLRSPPAPAAGARFARVLAGARDHEAPASERRETFTSILG